jgi:hypothetical protein
MVVSFAEVVEGVRTTVAAHAQAEDDGRFDDLVALYHPRGSVQIAGGDLVEGADALRKAYAEWAAPVPRRHAVVNTLLVEWSDDDAHATSDVVVLEKAESGWSVRAVGRYHDSLQLVDEIWLIRRRVVEFV